VSCAKTARPIEMPFEGLSRVSPGNHVLNRDADAATGKVTFRGVTGPLQKHRTCTILGVGLKGEFRRNWRTDSNDRITCFYANR